MIWAILAVGLILRLISLNQSLWLDEAINVLATKNYSLFGMVTEYAKADFHPPGYFILIWIWTKFFGIGEVSVRIPSVIFGILTVYVIFLIGKKLHSKTLGLFSALLLAINPLHIYYSQEARMYALAALAVSVNIFLLIKYIKGEKLNITFLMISNLAILASDYVAYLIFPAQFIFLLLGKKVKVIKSWLLGLSIASLLFVWWVPVFLTQLKIGSMTVSSVPTWTKVVGDIGVKPLALTYIKFIIGRINFSPPAIYVTIFLPVGLLFLYLIWCGYRFADKFAGNLLTVWLLTPIILAALISLLMPVYSYFRLLFVLPSFLILTVLGIYSLKPKLKVVFLTLVIVFEMIFSAIYLFNPQFQREDWRELVSFLKLQSKDSKILFESSGSFASFDYYAGSNFKGIGALKNFPAKDDKDIIDLKVSVEDSTDIYLINYLVEISDPQRLVQKQLIKLNYKQTDIKNFNGVGFVYHYVKNE